MNYAKFVNDPKTFAASPEEVEEAARWNPMLSSCIALWRSGQCTWEQALASAVVILAVDLVPMTMQRWENAKCKPEGESRPAPAE